jgi:hypothetical protein
MKLAIKFLLGSIFIFILSFIIIFFPGRHPNPKNAVQDEISNDPVLSMNPYSASSPIYREFNQYRQWILNNKKLAAASDTARPSDLLMLSGQLAAKGMPRLSTDLLEQRFSSVNRILPSLNIHTCSTLIKGGFSATEFTAQSAPRMNSFDTDEAKAWFSVGKAAIEAQLNGAPIIVLSTEDAARGVLKISKSMHEPQSQSFLSVMANLKTASDEDACETVQILYSRGNSLPEPYRGYVARMLLTGDEGNEKI